MPNLNTPSGIPNAITRTLLCVDSLESHDYSGTAYNPYLPRPVVFQGIKSYLDAMEDFFNDISFPQSYFESRSFLNSKTELEQKPVASPERFSDNSLFNEHSGKLATFEVEVRFRKNATWQGELLWKERQQSAPFRSTLELIKLVDNAIRRGVLTADQSFSPEP